MKIQSATQLRPPNPKSLALPVPVGRHGHGGHGGRLDDVGGGRRLLFLLPEEEVPSGAGAEQPEEGIVEGAANVKIEPMTLIRRASFS